MLIPNALAASIVQAVVPGNATPDQRALALATWIKICGALVPYFQANIQITVPPITGIVNATGANAGGPVVSVGTSVPPNPTIIIGVQ